MTLNAAKKLRDISSVLYALTRQEGMLLLRYCFNPILNYFLRTLLPNFGMEDVKEFDHITWEIVARWVKDDTIDPNSRENHSVADATEGPRTCGWSDDQEHRCLSKSNSVDGLFVIARTSFDRIHHADDAGSHGGAGE